ncbi:unnamed protein product [Diamesa serratosioi]
MTRQILPRNDNEVIEPRVKFEEIPLSAVGIKTRYKMSLLLNPEKILPSEDGYHRDWRGLAALVNLSQSEYNAVSHNQDKIATLFDIWIKQNKGATISTLMQCLELIDRYDVSDDIQSLFVEDAKVFLSPPKRKPDYFESVHQSEPDSEIVTTQDYDNAEKGLSLQLYDAFVMYDDRDSNFAEDIIDRLEEMGLKLCTSQRDFLVSSGIDLEVILNILMKRCHRLIVVVSKNFLESNHKKYITNYAQALGIEQGQRKIIPCLIEFCELPTMLRYCFRLDYYRQGKLFDFWNKLYKSIKPRPVHSLSPESASIVELSNQAIALPSIVESPGDDQIPTISFEQPLDEPKRQIMPPLPKLRGTTSMLDIRHDNNNILKTPQLSQSTFALNATDNISQSSDLIKKKKWYKPWKSSSHTSDTIKEKEEKKEKKTKCYIIDALIISFSNELSSLLNPETKKKSAGGYYKNWRGIARLVRVNNSRSLKKARNKMATLLEVWRNRNNQCSIFDLYSILDVIERWDVYDTVRSLVLTDIKESGVTNFIPPEIICEKDIITDHDVDNYDNGLPPQEYDAFVLFADDDRDFVLELIDNLETIGYKLCLKERDFIGGLPMEHDAIMRLLSNKRCKRLLLVVSKEFFNKNLNNFIMLYAQGLDIGDDKKKIVPCIIENLIMPENFFCYSKLEYDRAGRLYNFWKILKSTLGEKPIYSYVPKQLPAEKENKIINKTSDDPESKSPPNKKSKFGNLLNSISSIAKSKKKDKKCKEKEILSTQCKST